MPCSAFSAIIISLLEYSSFSSTIAMIACWCSLLNRSLVLRTSSTRWPPAEILVESVVPWVFVSWSKSYLALIKRPWRNFIFCLYSRTLSESLLSASLGVSPSLWRDWSFWILIKRFSCLWQSSLYYSSCCSSWLFSVFSSST